MSKIFVANFLSAFSCTKFKKSEQTNIPEIATPATLNAPMLATVSEI